MWIIRMNGMAAVLVTDPFGYYSVTICRWKLNFDLHSNKGVKEIRIISRLDTHMEDIGYAEDIGFLCHNHYERTKQATILM